MGTSIGLLIVGIALGVLAGAFVGARLLVSRRASDAEEERKRLDSDAERAAAAIRREAEVEAREHALKLRADLEQELKDRRAEIIKIEERVAAKEGGIDQGSPSWSAGSRACSTARRT